MNKDIYIILLELGREKGISGVSHREIWNKLKRTGHLSTADVEELERNIQLSPEVSRKWDSIYDLVRELFNRYNENCNVLKNENFFRLIEYEELKLARQASSSAKTYSIIAISISVIAVAISAWIGIEQLNTPIEFKEDQIINVLDSNSKLELQKISKELENSIHFLQESDSILKNALSSMKKRQDNILQNQESILILQKESKSQMEKK